MIEEEIKKWTHKAKLDCLNCDYTFGGYAKVSLTADRFYQYF